MYDGLLVRRALGSTDWKSVVRRRIDGLEVRRTVEDRRTGSPSYGGRSTDWKSVVRGKIDGLEVRRTKYFYILE